MLHHILIKVAMADHDTAVKFYAAALAPLGATQLAALSNGWTAFGKEAPEFWIAPTDKTPNVTIHIGFGATDANAVQAFHKAALVAGAKDNGPPGLRTQVHPNYYAAFVLDSCGNNIEAGCMVSDEEAKKLSAAP